MDCSMPGFLVFYYLLEFAHIHVHWVSDAILTISSSATTFSFCLQSFQAWRSFPMSWLFTSNGQSIEASASVHIHNWALFPLWPSSCILFAAISNCLPLFPSSMLDTFQPGGLIFRCYIFLLFCNIHGVVRTARILERFVIPSSIGPRFVRPLLYDPSVLGGLAWHGS